MNLSVVSWRFSLETSQKVFGCCWSETLCRHEQECIQEPLFQVSAGDLHKLWLCLDNTAGTHRSIQFRIRLFILTSSFPSEHYDKAMNKFTLTNRSALDAIFLTMKLSEPLKDDFIASDTLMLNSLAKKCPIMFVRERRTWDSYFSPLQWEHVWWTYRNASACLDLFLRSLPVGSYFNTVCFGSDSTSLFPASFEYNDENVQKALEGGSGVERGSWG